MNSENINIKEPEKIVGLTSDEVREKIRLGQVNISKEKEGKRPRRHKRS